MQVGQLKWIEKYVGSMQELGGHHRVAAGEEPTKRTKSSGGSLTTEGAAEFFTS